ncbi:MAG TPA: zinc ribbon domain-containing protein [Nitrososphaeraceae archaeon]|nr:zinc ribbon domain-containing protein [Nitrososphaeraceae archaeon]
MPSGLDNLGGSMEKLKQMINSIQEEYESFIDSNQLYKQGKVNEKEFFVSIGNYLVAMSTMNFLAIQVIFEIKSAIEKKSTNKSGQDRVPSKNDFEIGGVVNQPTGIEEYTLPKPQQLQRQDLHTTSNPDTRQTSKIKGEETHITKNCNSCGVAIPKKAKFCSRCGKSQ